MTTEAERLAKSLRIKAGCISMGEMIAWGSDSALMDQAAVFVEQQAAEIERLKADLAHTEECCTGWAGDFGKANAEIERLKAGSDLAVQQAETLVRLRDQDRDKANALLRQTFDAMRDLDGYRADIDAAIAAIKQHLGEV